MGSKVSMEERQKQIGVAVEFLKNPKIQSESKEMKISFLSQKGLTDDMIQEAFNKYTEMLIKSEVQNCLEDEKQQDKLYDTHFLIEQSFQSYFVSLRGMNMKMLKDDLVEKLIHLKVLILNNNPIKTFPQNINKISNLQVLQAQNCKLTDQSFPQTFYELYNLENLNLSNNFLSKYKNFEQLKSIQVLVLKNNEINILIDFDKDTIKKIFLQGNPINDQSSNIENDIYILQQQIINFYQQLNDKLGLEVLNF